MFLIGVNDGLAMISFSHPTRPGLNIPFRAASSPKRTPSLVCCHNSQDLRSKFACNLVAGSLLALSLSLFSPSPGLARTQQPDDLGAFPDQISSAGEEPRQSLGKMLKGEKGKQISECSRKCLPTCLRGGQGAPGLGPITLRRDLVVFKDGFRDRKYCLTECTTVCALSFGGGDASASSAAAGGK